MQQEYNFFVTPAAENDLDSIFDYISETLHAPMAALNLLDEFYKTARFLCGSPYMYELCRNEALAKKGYRKMVIKNYVAPYLVDEKNKLIVFPRVFYGAMDYEKYL
jgi:plasmid stabilization system protein ParE